MSDNPMSEMPPEQRAAIEKFKAETGIDPTPVINLVKRMRERPEIEEALLRAAANQNPDNNDPSPDQNRK